MKSINKDSMGTTGFTMFFLPHQAPSPFAPFQSYILGQKHAIIGFLLLWKQAHEYTPPQPHAQAVCSVI